MNNFTTLIGQITYLRIVATEHSVSGQPKRLSLFYRITLDNKQTVIIICPAFLDIRYLDTIEVIGPLSDGAIFAQELKLIKKYIPIQRRIWDFEK